VDALVAEVAKALQERVDRAKKRVDDPDDSEDAVMVENTEAENADNMTDLVAKLASIFGDNFGGLFDQTCAKLCAELFSSEEPDDTDLAMCMFVEVIKHAPKTCGKYVSRLLAQCEQMMKTEADSNAQSVAFAIGVFAEKNLLRDSSEWIQKLSRLVEGSEFDASVKDNATSAMGKILKYAANQVETKKLIPMWIQLLPLREDEDELPFCNTFLLDILKKDLQGLLQMDNKIGLKVLASAIVGIQRDEPRREQFAQLLQQLQKIWGPDGFKQYSSRLPQELQRDLGNILANNFLSWKENQQVNG